MMTQILDNILGAVAIVGIFAGVLVEALKRTEVVSLKLLPIVSLIVGMLAGLTLAIGFEQDLPTFVAAGFIGGAMASGIYDSGSSAVAFLKDFMGGKK